MTSRAMLKPVNMVLLILFTVQAAGGILHEAIPYRFFSTGHAAGGMVLLVLAVVHVLLNRKWFATVFKNNGPNQK